MFRHQKQDHPFTDGQLAPDALPDGEVAETLLAFGVQPTQDVATDRATLRSLASNPLQLTPHPLELHIQRFLALPSSLQHAVVNEAVAQHEPRCRSSVNTVHALQLMGARVLSSYVPQCNEHVELLNSATQGGADEDSAIAVAPGDPDHRISLEPGESCDRAGL